MLPDHKQIAMKNAYRFIVAAISLSVFTLSASAQYIPQENQPEPDPLRAEFTGKGQGLTDFGKTMMLTGAAFAVKGLATFTIGSLTFVQNPETPDTPLYPVFALIDGAIGAGFTLIGLPFYLAGKGKMDDMGGSMITFGGDSQTGPAGIVEMSMGLAPFVGLDAIGGYNFNKNIFVGGGIGYNHYTTAGLRQDGLSFPLYAHGRFSFGDKRVVPYIGIEAGVDLAQKGLYSGIDFGTRLRRIGGKRGSSWWLAGSMDMLGADLYHIALKFGRSF